jgi:hypothetical protein
MLLLITALIGAIGFAWNGRSMFAGQRSVEREVLGAIDAFLEAMRVRDTAAMRAGFIEGARFTGIRTRADSTPRLQILTVDDFVGFVARDARAQWIERIWNPEIRVSGTLATVWAEYDFHFGTTPSHCGVDSIQLLKVDGTWKVASIADTYVTAGCAPRAPPPARSDARSLQ